MEVLDSGSFESYSQPSARTTTRVKYPDGQLSLECLPPEVPTIKNAKPDGDLTSPNSAVYTDTSSSNGEQTDASGKKLKEVMKEMNQALNVLSGSVVTPDSATSQTEENDSVPMGEENSDPALLKAISKMKKLDIKLADVTKRERRVKKQRKKLGKLLEDGMEPSSALALVQSELNSDEEPSPPPSPVFPTELKDKPAQTTQPKETSHEPCTGTNITSKGSNKKNLPKPTQNFIKRNIELVQDAGSLVAMTEEEKKRLEELLEDGIIEDIEEPKETQHNELALINEMAFTPDETNLERLREIDSRLEAMLPVEDHRSIISTPESSEVNYTEFKEALKAFHDEELIEESEQPGEIALMEFKHSRGEQQRLREIDQRLKYLETCTDDENLPTLSADQLKELIDQCCREQRIMYPSNQSSPLPLGHDGINNSQ